MRRRKMPSRAFLAAVLVTFAIQGMGSKTPPSMPVVSSSVIKMVKPSAALKTCVCTQISLTALREYGDAIIAVGSPFQDDTAGIVESEKRHPAGVRKAHLRLV